MLSKDKFYEKLKRDILLEERGGYVYFNDVYIPSLYDKYLKEGYDSALSYIHLCVGEAAVLDRVLEKPDNRDLFPVIDNEFFIPHIYAYAQGKYVSRIVPAEGPLEIAKKNLKKLPIMKWTYDSYTYYAVDYLAASLIMTEDFPDGFLMIPSQGVLIHMKSDDIFEDETQIQVLKLGMLASDIGSIPPSKPINVVGRVIDGEIFLGDLSSPEGMCRWNEETGITGPIGDCFTGENLSETLAKYKSRKNEKSAI